MITSASITGRSPRSLSSTTAHASRDSHFRRFWLRPVTGLAVEVPEAIRPYVSLCCGRSRTLAQAISTTPEVIAWLPRSGLAIAAPGLYRGGGAASVPVWMSGGVVCAGRYEQRSEALGGGVRYLVDRRTAEMRRMGGSVASGLIATP